MLLRGAQSDRDEVVPVQQSVAGSLIDALRERVAATGPLTFADFMSLALYHPRFGYYASRVPGHLADYRTSPSITPMFGELVGRELSRMWEALGQPSPFWVIEPGAGRADLAAAALGSCSPPTLAAAIRWRFVEHMDRVRAWQAQRLGPLVAAASWSGRLDGGGGPVTGCVLANEVLDNFPVHVLAVGHGGEPREVYVDVAEGHLVERVGALSSAALAPEAFRACEYLPDGTRFEICPGLGPWCREAYAALERGYLLLLDYGDTEPSFWHEHPGGSVATHGPPELAPSWLEDPGAKDITAGVNFSAVGRAAAAAGFGTPCLCSQQAFLLSVGLAQMASDLELAGLEAALGGWIEEASALDTQLQLLFGLADPEGLGSVFVFQAAKGAPAFYAERGSPAAG